ncbi:MAG TPA: PH domain-containing protein [Acidothermaceae bacterium]|nr:PH domain-containing protein [Acidothermaceae bacterium]
MQEAFAPPGERWVGVSPRLRAMRRTEVAVVAGVVAVVLAVVFAAAGSVSGAVMAVVGILLLGAAGFIIVGRNYNSWGYAERGADLLVTHGVLVRRLVVVPYGRMQLVDVTAGPIERKFGISTLRLHTASAGTDARIHGLTAAEATRLRDRLAALGESQSAGL